MTDSRTAYQRMVDALVLQNVPRDRAEARARELCSDAPAIVTKDPSIAEKAEQKKVMEIFIERGFKCRSTSQSRPSKVTIGIPDLIVSHKTRPIWFWFETKRQVGGVVSEAQAEFAAECQRAGVLWFTGDRFEAQRVADDLIARDDELQAERDAESRIGR